ncbi:MAG: lipocalin family protein [bacterium]|nr:lipocalin family protein [bacterium]
MKRRCLTAILALTVLSSSCFQAKQMGELNKVSTIDPTRFMGDWYVVANIPTFIEKGAVNAIETYSLREDGDVDIRFTFRKGTPTGELKTYTAKGFVVDRSTFSEWRVQFFWPIKFPYYVLDLDQEYTYTVVGTSNRSYAWIMTREPNPPDSLIQHLISKLEKAGFDPFKIQRVPQTWTKDIQ